MTLREEEFADVIDALKTIYAADPLPRSVQDRVRRGLDRTPARKGAEWMWPLTAAALLLAGMIAGVALSGEPPSAVPGAQDRDAERLEDLRREIARVKEEIRIAREALAEKEKPPPAEAAPPSSVGHVTAVAAETGLVVISLGKNDGVAETGKYWIHRGGEFVALIAIDRADRQWSAGKILYKKSDPRPGDRAELAR